MKEWQYYKLDELGTVRRGRSRHRPRNAPHLYGGKYPFVQTADIKAANLYLTSYIQTYSEAGLAQSKLWEPGTLCITIAANIADTAILGIPACFPDSVIGFTPYEGKSDARYIKYYFNIFQKTFQQISQGATQDNLSAEKLLSMKIPVPPLPTQQKIAGILSAYDDLIENNLKRIKLLEEMAQIIYEEWFVRMRFPGYESVSIDPTTGLPDEWKQLKCFDVMEVLSGGTPKTNTDEYWNGGTPFYTPKDAVEYSYVFETEKYVTDLGVSKCNSKLYPKDTVFITARGTVGKVNLAGCSMAMNQSCYALIGKLGIPQYFLFFSVKSSIDGFKGASNGGVFNTIVVDTFRFLPFILPTHDLIYQFNDSVSPSLSEVSNLIQQNRLLREARDILLPRLMTGIIDVESYNPADLLKEVA